MKILSFLSSLFAAILLAGLFITCQKDLDIDDPGNNNNTQDTAYFVVEGVKVANGAVIEKGFTHVKIRADFSAFKAETFTVTDHGHVVSKSTQLPTVTNNDGISSKGEVTEPGNFVSEITGLEPGTTYHARVYIEKKDKATGAVTPGYHPKSISFTTLNPEEPNVIDTLKNVMSSSFLLEGKITDFKGKDVLNYGFIWSTTHTNESTLKFDQNEGKKEFGQLAVTESHSFSFEVQNLEADKTYYARAFARNEFGYGYGKILQITTLAAPKPLVVIDSVFLVSDANNTGQPNPGELVTYNVILKNIGEVTADNVEANFYSTGATIVSSQPVVFGSIVPDAKKSRQVQLQVSNLATAGDVVKVTTEINGDNLQLTTDNSRFAFTVAAPPAPDIIIQSVEVTEPNGTGNVNPGEEVTLKITLKNKGDADANGLMLSIGQSPHYSFVSVLPVDFGTLVPGGQKTKDVVVKVGSSVAWNTFVTVAVTVNDDQGTNWAFPNGATFTVISPYVVSNGLSFYLRFNECNGPTAASSVGDFLGFLYGSEFSNNTIPGINGCSMEFNSSEADYLQFASNPFYNFTTASFSFWLSTNAANAMLFHGNTNGNSDGYWLQIKNNKFDSPYEEFDFQIDLTNFLSITEWHHFVLVAGDAGKAKLYIDGILMNIRSGYNGINATNHDGFYLGKSSFSSQFSYPPFSGKMDNFRIYNRALSETEVQKIFDAKQ
jgi:hypothetical protein